MIHLIHTFIAEQCVAAGIPAGQVHQDALPTDSVGLAVSFGPTHDPTPIPWQERNGGMTEADYDVLLHAPEGVEQYPWAEFAPIDARLDGASWTILDAGKLYELGCDKTADRVVPANDGADDTLACGARYLIRIQQVG